MIIWVILGFHYLIFVVTFLISTFEYIIVKLILDMIIFTTLLEYHILFHDSTLEYFPKMTDIQGYVLQHYSETYHTSMFLYFNKLLRNVVKARD